MDDPSTPDQVSIESIDPPATFTRPRTETDDESAAISVISTDLSKYMANNADQTGSDDDSDSTTIAESAMQSQCDTAGGHVEQSQPGDIPVPVTTTDTCKLTRSASFTISHPSFVLPAQADIGQQKKVAFSITTDDGHNAKSSANSRSIDWTSRIVQDQIKRLTEMQISLKLYHQMQLDDLKCKQQRELETLETQKAFLASILAERDSNLDNARNVEISCRNQIGNVNNFGNKKMGNQRRVKSNVNSIQKPPQIAILQSEEICDRKLTPNWNVEAPEVLKRRLGGLVRGYLARRWLKTKKVKKMTTAIKDLQAQLVSLEREGPLDIVDETFKKTLVMQLQSSKSQFSRFLQTQTKSDRLNIIKHDRYECQTKRPWSSLIPPEQEHPFGLVSSATMKSLIRKRITGTSGTSGTTRHGTPSARVYNRHKKNVIRISPRSKSTLPSSTYSPRQRKRYSSFSPSFCVLRSPRREQIGPVSMQGHRTRTGQRSRGTSEDSMRSSTTMNIRMTMNTVTNDQEQRWSGFYHVGNKQNTQNRKPWR